MNPVRKYWLDNMLKIVTPVLDALSQDNLRREMPVECQKEVTDRENYTYLEAFGRVVTGIAPWLAGKPVSDEEETLRQKYAALVRRCIQVAVDPDAADKMNFSDGDQPIVDAAFLAQGILRAPKELWDPLDDVTKQRLLDAMRQTRSRRPYKCNWLLFSAMIECLLHHAGAPDWDPMRIDYALLKHAEWYKGDGWYGDGDTFHLDYYNSFVIQPMLLDVLDEMRDEFEDWKEFAQAARLRAAHYAAHLEQLISPEGTYPLFGRSLTYRFGAFHALAAEAYHHNLEEGMTPAQVRCALTAVIQNILSFEDMFDSDGWMQIGVCGHQPEMGERYISTGSLYLCSTVFLPLGLDENDPFWSAPDADWTMKKLWKGQNLRCGHALDL